MKQSVKLIISAAGLVVLVAGASILYSYLKDNYNNKDNGSAVGSSDIQLKDQGEGDTSSLQEEKPEAPDFTVYDKDGNAVSLSDFKGKPVVLNFWASWCKYCKEEMPAFESVWSEYGDEVVFMMLNATDGRQETREKGEKYIKEGGYKFPVYYDEELQAVNGYGISSFPTTYFINADGTVETGILGRAEEKDIRQRLAMILPSEEPEESSLEGVGAGEEAVTEVPSWCNMEPEYARLTAKEAKEAMDSFEAFTILDVRSKAEYDEGHIENAVLIPDNEIKDKIEAAFPDKTEIIFVYCRTGKRSEAAAKELVKLGYNHVYDFGGIVDWEYGTVK